MTSVLCAGCRLLLLPCLALAPAAQAAEPTWVPADLHRGLVFLRGTVDGVETELVLDSGAGMTVVDERLAARLELAPGGAVTATGAGGTQAARFVGGFELACGDLALDLRTAVCIDLADVAAAVGREMPLILGLEAFERHVVDIDYPNARVAFRPRAGFVYSGPGRALPLTMGKGRLRELEASVEDLPPARFVLDTGARGLALFGAYTERHRLLEGRAPLSERESTGVGASFPSRVATLRSFTLAGYRFTGVPCGFAEREEGTFASDEHAGNLGASVLARFRVIADFARDTLYLEPAPGWDTRPFERDRLGLTVRFEEDALVVRFVAPGSPAARAGWTPGRRIRALQGEAFTSTTWVEALRRSAEAPPGTRVLLRDDQGVEHELVTADYY
ncbi:MAG TPA: aspartyl protease family protein [Planctomycetota bacterium]